MTRLATHAAAAAAGALLALLLTQPATSRVASVPRPAATILATLRPVAPLRTAAPNPAAVVMTPQPTTGTRPALEGTPATAIPSPGHTPKPKPRRTTRPSHSLTGVSTWYAYIDGQAAAGPRLRAALGDGWRGTVVTVTGDGGSVAVQLTDFMGTRNRAKVIDLDDGTFRVVCGPLSMGVCEVTVRW